MNDENFFPLVSDHGESIEVLRGLLEGLRNKPASQRSLRNSTDPHDWNLAQMTQAKMDVTARYAQVFSPENLDHLDQATIAGFLKFQNNHHWYGLDRLGGRITADMPRLRSSLRLLLDETKPLADRLNQLRPLGGPPLLPSLGPALITGILQVVYPDRYGVLNNITVRGMKQLGLWPSHSSGKSFAAIYEEVNRLLIAVTKELGTDLWTLDYLWWMLPRARQANEPQGRVGASEDAPAVPPVSGPISESEEIGLPSGLCLRLEEAYSRLLRFCEEEYDYYDHISDLSPHRVEPLDVLVTLSMNSFINDATKVRTVHRGLAGRCDSILPRIPVDADLLVFDPDLDAFGQLIHAAVQAPGVMVPVATKVLHRKRRGFVPMLDSVLINHYLSALNRPDLREMSQLKMSAASVAVEVLKEFRRDLSHTRDQIGLLQARLANKGFDLSKVRILEVLIWMETERNGYYRTARRESPAPEAAKNLTMTTLGRIETNLIYSRPPGKTSASAIVPPESFNQLEADRGRFGVKTVWMFDVDPKTGQRRPAFTPIQGGRLKLIEGAGIRHGDHFVATFEVRDVTRPNRRQNEMWLVKACPLGQPGP
jgi:hypothetical protein